MYNQSTIFYLKIGSKERFYSYIYVRMPEQSKSLDSCILLEYATTKGSALTSRVPCDPLFSEGLKLAVGPRSEWLLNLREVSFKSVYKRSSTDVTVSGTNVLDEQDDGITMVHTNNLMLCTFMTEHCKAFDENTGKFAGSVMYINDQIINALEPQADLPTGTMQEIEFQGFKLLADLLFTSVKVEMQLESMISKLMINACSSEFLISDDFFANLADFGKLFITL